MVEFVLVLAGERHADLRNGHVALGDVDQCAGHLQHGLAVLCIHVVFHLVELKTARIHLHAELGIERRRLRPRFHDLLAIERRRHSN